MLVAIAAGLLLVAGVLSAVALGVTWASDNQGGNTLAYKATEFEVSGPGFAASVDYTDDNADDSDGIGLIRAGGPLLIVGLVFAFLAMAALAVSLFVRGAHVTLGGASAAALAALLLVLTVILLPIGISQNADEGGLDLAWGAGLYLGVFAAAMAIAAAALGFLARFRPGSDLS